MRPDSRYVVTVNTPPLLLGAAVLFWGWHAGLFPVAVVLASVLEGSRLLKTRWQFSQSDLNRIGNLCIFLFLATLALALISEQGMAILDNSPRANSPAARAQALNKTAKSFLLFVQWLPLVFFPVAAAQAYGQTAGMKLMMFWPSLRGHAGHEPSLGASEINVGFPYFALCILAASTSAQRVEFFYLGMTVLLVWALWTQRVRRFAPAAVAVVTLMVCLGGYAGTHGIRELQRIVTAWDSALLSRLSGHDFNPREHRSLLGAIGRIKTSGKIVLWVKANGQAPPPLLREASYDQFTSPVWHSSDREFPNTPSENDQTTWKLLPNPSPHSVTISRLMPAGRPGLLAFPNGTVELRHLPVFGLRTNTMAVLKADGPGYVSYQAHYGQAGIDSQPTIEDKRVASKEINVIAQIANELNLSALADENPATAIQAVAKYFQQNFTYSTYLEAKMRGATNRSAIARFLTEHRKGHCEYFASATVLLLRQAEIPARYAVGYSVQERRGGKYVVRDRHAHAWCLAFVNGAWLDVDTTPPAWNAIEAQRAPWWEPVSDAWTNLMMQFSRLRWSGVNYRKYLIWSLFPAGIALAILIYRRRQWIRAKRPAQQHRRTVPGLDSEFFLVESRLRELGLERNEGEPLRVWLLRVNGSAPRNGVPLEDLLTLHYRYRFDPAGLPTEERQVLRDKATAWLRSTSGQPN